MNANVKAQAEQVKLEEARKNTEAVEKALEAQAAAMLSEELRDEAQEQGAELGAYSLAKVSSQWAQCKLALTLGNLTREGYVANLTPLQASYIDAAMRAAWDRAAPGTEMVISHDNTLKNIATTLKVIARAYSLDGILKTDKGEKYAVRDKLNATLGKGQMLGAKDSGSAKGGSGIAAALSMAKGMLLQAEKQALNDLELSAAAKGVLTKDPTKKGRGQPLKAPSAENVNNFLTKLPLASPNEVKRVMLGALHAWVNAIPAQSNQPKVQKDIDMTRAWVLSHGEAFVEEAAKRVQKIYGELTAPMSTRVGPEDAGHGIAFQMHAEARAGVDDVSKARKARKAAKQVAPLVEGEAIKAA